jgi:hypothetical protein
MNTITYYAPISATPQSALDYNPQVYEDGTAKAPGWLTPEEFAAAFPPPAPEPPSLEEQIQDFMSGIQARLDNFARTRGYDSVLSAASYAASNNATYQAEGQYVIDARDATWEWSNDYLNQVLAGQKEIPSWEEFEAELEAAVPLVWPAEDIIQN